MHDLSFVPISEIAPELILQHMSDPRVAVHLPLLNAAFDKPALDRFLASKAACWARDGLGHWGICNHGDYVGWGGFERVGETWDFGLVLKPECFGLGVAITQKALRFARAHPDIDQVWFLLAPSRRKLRAMHRLGATYEARVEHHGTAFLKYSLDTR